MEGFCPGEGYLSRGRVSIQRDVSVGGVSSRRRSLPGGGVYPGEGVSVQDGVSVQRVSVGGSL